jgi:octaprenyl-diphosphate synthase
VLASVVELIHTATLVHDDVLDEAAIRRHLDTVNARWDNETSVLLGDYLFARSICLASSLNDLYATQTLSAAARIMCEGELSQVESRGNYELGEDRYLEIIGRKTAELLASCCRLGAFYAGAPAETVDALGRYGYQLGKAFQIADDVLDLLGDEKTVGKSLGTDLFKQKATLPLIRLLDQTASGERQKLIDVFSASDNHRREVLQTWLARTDAISYAREKALAFTDSAVEELGGFAPSESLDSLRGLADFVVNRQL